MMRQNKDSIKEGAQNNSTGQISFDWTKEGKEEKKGDKKSRHETSQQLRHFQLRVIIKRQAEA